MPCVPLGVCVRVLVRVRVPVDAPVPDLVLRTVCVGVWDALTVCVGVWDACTVRSLERVRVDALVRDTAAVGVDDRVEAAVGVTVDDGKTSVSVSDADAVRDADVVADTVDVAVSEDVGVIVAVWVCSGGREGTAGIRVDDRRGKAA